MGRACPADKGKAGGLPLREGGQAPQHTEGWKVLQVQGEGRQLPEAQAESWQALHWGGGQDSLGVSHQFLSSRGDQSF